MLSFGAKAVDVLARRALLDALEVLETHLESLILIGAQAVYLHTNHFNLPLAPATTDADIAFDTRALSDSPELSALLKSAGYFEAPSADGTPGHWLNKDGVPLDLYQPRALSALGGKRRTAVIAPHLDGVLRIGDGLDCVLVDNAVMTIESFEESDKRVSEIKVAGPTAMLVAKVAKIADREFAGEKRWAYKDAHDVFRILKALETEPLADSFKRLLADPLCSKEAEAGLAGFVRLFAGSQDATGNLMAAEAARGTDEAEQIQAEAWALAADLVDAIGESKSL